MDYHEQKAKKIIREGLAKFSISLGEKVQLAAGTKNPYAIVEESHHELNEMTNEIYGSLLGATNGVL